MLEGTTWSASHGAVTASDRLLPNVGASRPDGESKDRHPLGEETHGFGIGAHAFGTGSSNGKC